ncbi:MAG: hypothetical protein CFK48_12140, partial [Armatimonadetes bacterium CP1_7O]
TERENLREFLRLLAEGKVQVEPLITHRYPIDRAAEAYELLASPEGGKILGALIEYPPPKQVVRRVPASKPAPKQAKVKLGVIGAGNFATGTLIPILQGIADVE